jgi:hypothetical protein
VTTKKRTSGKGRAKLTLKKATIKALAVKDRSAHTVRAGHVAPSNQITPRFYPC